MAKVIKIADQNDLVPAKKYKLAHWDFDNLNSVQSRVFDYFEGDSNMAVAAATSSGKTVVAEMFMAYETRKRGGKAIYIGPMKALAKQKQEEWTADDHHFNDLNISICTGDYRLTQKRVKELDESNIVVMTPEMLASRCRNCVSEKSRFLQDTGTIVFDESHLLTVPTRGDHIEVALMKMAEINPDVRIVLLSATMPNVDEICEWSSTLTGRDTYYLESTYRPCPLNIHYETYYDGERYYERNEEQKIGSAIAIIEDYPSDKFLVFVHGKRTGRKLVDHLKRHNIHSEFHNADLSLKERLKLEAKFKDDKKFRVLIATSTLAWGLNLPARRVIVLGVHRGVSQVANYDIQQMVGRAGRPRFDPMGDAYILVPESKAKETIEALKKPTPITSQLLQTEGDRYKTLAFHIVSEIYYRNVVTKEGFHHWFKKSLAHFQDQGFDDVLIDNVIDSLVKCYACYVNEQGEYQTTPVGKIASIFYFSPFDVSELRRNFKSLFENKKEYDDICTAVALADIDSFRWGIASREEREQTATFKIKMEALNGRKYTDAVVKTAYAYYNLLIGRYDVPAIGALQATLRVDCGRTMQVITALDGMSAKWGKADYLKTLSSRLVYGVEGHLVALCQIEGIGKVRSERLWNNGIKGVDDFLATPPDVLAKVMKLKLDKVNECRSAAQVLQTKKLLE